MKKFPSHEIEYLNNKLSDMRDELPVMSKNLQDSLEQSSETWHDNAVFDDASSEMANLQIAISKLEEELFDVSTLDTISEIAAAGSLVKVIKDSTEEKVFLIKKSPLYENDNYKTISGPLLWAMLY